MRAKTAGKTESTVSTRYQLDARDRVVAVDAGWTAFAIANEANALASADIIGRSLWEFIAGPAVAHVYRALFDDVRRSWQTVCVPFRCDSPDRIRQMRLEITPAEGGALDLYGRLLHEESRAPMPRFGRLAEASDPSVELCSVCKRVEVAPAEWIGAEEAVARLSLFDSRTGPGVFHALCPECRDEMEEPPPI